MSDIGRPAAYKPEYCELAHNYHAAPFFALVPSNPLTASRFESRRT